MQTCKTKVGVVIPARNEERYLPKTLEALLSQTIKPHIIVVVDDGSTDATPKIAEEFGATVIRLSDRGFRSVGLPLVAQVVNVGLKFLERENIDYVMKLDADHVLSRTYIEEIIRAMVEDKRLVVASGIIVGEASYSVMPRGSGRVIRASWFRRVGFRYPVWWGYESWLLYKALKMGMRVEVVKSARSWVQRKTAWSPLELYEWGRGMRALGYHPVYAISRSFYTLVKRGLSNMTYMLIGYFTPTAKYEDIENFVRAYTIRLLFKRVLSLI